jgi:hypothetical protein
LTHPIQDEPRTDSSKRSRRSIVLYGMKFPAWLCLGVWGVLACCVPWLTQLMNKTSVLTLPLSETLSFAIIKK